MDYFFQFDVYDMKVLRSMIDNGAPFEIGRVAPDGRVQFRYSITSLLPVRNRNYRKPGLTLYAAAVVLAFALSWRWMNLMRALHWCYRYQPRRNASIKLVFLHAVNRCRGA
jgi:hypothetical protein